MRKRITGKNRARVDRSDANRKSVDRVNWKPKAIGMAGRRPMLKCMLTSCGKSVLSIAHNEACFSAAPQISAMPPRNKENELSVSVLLPEKW